MRRMQVFSTSFPVSLSVSLICTVYLIYWSFNLAIISHTDEV